MTRDQLFQNFRNAKSPEDMLTIAKENGIELTEDNAKYYFETYFSSGALSDDELENVSGGGCKDNEAKPITPEYQKPCFVCVDCYASYNNKQTHYCSVRQYHRSNYCTSCIFYRNMDKGVPGDYCKK